MFIKLLFSLNNCGVTSDDLCSLSAVSAISVDFRHGAVVFANFYLGIAV